MDGDELSYDETKRALGDLRRVNRWLWGYPSVVRSLLLGLRSGQRVLDIGTGSGDVAAAVQQAAKRRGVAPTVIGVDFKLRHLALGRDWHPNQLRVVASADALPFADSSVDHSFSSLFFHHFGTATNTQVLKEMRRVSKERVVIVDLRRSLLLRLTIGPLLRLMGAGSVARNDGHLSVRCAWSLAQLRALISSDRALTDLAPNKPGRSEISDNKSAKLQRRFPFRFVLTLTGSRKPDQTLP